MVLALAFGVGIGLFATYLAYLRVRAQTREATGAATDTREEVAILMDNGVVIDTTPAAEALGTSDPLVGQSWHDLRSTLLDRFPDLPEHPPITASRFDARAPQESQLGIRPDDTRLRIVLDPTPDFFALAEDDALIGSPMETLLETVEVSPTAMWISDPEGHVTWCNPAYAKLLETLGAPDIGAPAFDLILPAPGARSTERMSLTDRTGQEHWFEIYSHAKGEHILHYATNIDALVEAEMAQRNFVQTLTKTFAHLPIGLAVFDRNRQLVLFNPALVDLTRLPADFLSARPNLMSFFDHMRENHMMEEPKNYASWREKLAEVINAARDDRYCETWNLPSGLTYKITGRPHPDGAVAFLLEDISAEISLTRHFRSELELTQSVIDCFEDAVAVFSQLGVLTFCNAAYRELWTCDPDSAIAEVTIVDATRDWKRACEPSPIWSEIREFVLTLRDRATWEAALETHDRRHLICTVEPVAAGATMVRFGTRAPIPPALAARDRMRVG